MSAGMIIKFIEATQGIEDGFNWGKFMLARFDAVEWAYRAALPAAQSHNLLRGRGWTPEHIVFLDLQTGEGCILRPGGSASADLQEHKVWVCPMAEPFLVWLYQQDLTDITTLPALVELPEAAPDMRGYRRPGC